MTSPSNHLRCLLIGPVLPFRGGIAQHTTMLHRALRARTDCLTLSFTRQYPKWLFPGKSDRDEALGEYMEPGVEYLLDSLSPFSWEAALTRVKSFSPNVAIVPWWHVYWSFCFGWLLRGLRRQGIETVLLCHNVMQHEDSAWRRQLSAFVFTLADRYVVHTHEDCAKLVSVIPKARVSVHPLPIFDQFPSPTVSLPRRARLELLFFGFIRPYKGLDVLLEAMTLLRNEEVHLTIVGEFWKGENETRHFLSQHGLWQQVELVSRYVSDAEAADYFARSDVVVLPYRSATGSAVVPLAYHYGKPVIASRVGGLPDVVEDGITGTLVEPSNSRALASVIKEWAASSGKPQFNQDGIARACRRMSWDSLVNELI